MAEQRVAENEHPYYWECPSCGGFASTVVVAPEGCGRSCHGTERFPWKRVEAVPAARAERLQVAIERHRSRLHGELGEIVAWRDSRDRADELLYQALASLDQATQAESAESSEPCPECKGIGRVRPGKPCPTCKGTGRLSESGEARK